MAACRMDREESCVYYWDKVKLGTRNITEDFFFSFSLDLIEEFYHLKVKYKVEVAKVLGAWGGSVG